MKKMVFWYIALAAMAVLLPGVLHAQGGLPDPDALASQTLRGYTHMFIAYAIAWVLIFGWIISIARRLGRIEKALKE